MIMDFMIIISIVLLIGLFIGFWLGYKFYQLENKDYKKLNKMKPLSQADINVLEKIYKGNK